jgi:hypothetical protein
MTTTSKQTIDPSKITPKNPFCPLRVQKQRATRSEDAVGKLKAQFLEREAHSEEMRTQLEVLSAGFSKVSKEKAQGSAEKTALKV